jgi:transposase InsO family protein
MCDASDYAVGAVLGQSKDNKYYVISSSRGMEQCSASQRIRSIMFHEVIFPRYRVPRIVTTDGGSHFIDRIFRKALTEVGVDHRIATPYHPQASGQAETSNK